MQGGNDSEIPKADYNAEKILGINLKFLIQSSGVFNLN